MDGTENDKKKLNIQEHAERNQHPARIEQQPYAPHAKRSLCEEGREVLRGVSHRLAVAALTRKPRAPSPHQDVRDDGDGHEYDEAGDEDAVELARFRVGQPRRGAGSALDVRHGLGPPLGLPGAALSPCGRVQPGSPRPLAVRHRRTDML